MADDPTTSTILRSVLISIVAKGLAVVSAWLISKGLVSPELLSTGNILILAAGIAAGLTTLGWTVFTKIRTWYLVEAARKAAPGTQMRTIKREAKDNSPV